LDDGRINGSDDPDAAYGKLVLNRLANVSCCCCCFCVAVS